MDLNRRVKRWPGWALLGVVVIALLVVGASRDAGPQNQRERIDAISKRVACPTCDGESVYESRASSSENVRREIARLVAESTLTDDEIAAQIDDAYDQDLRLSPSSSGLEGVAWFLPVLVAVLAVAGLAAAFRTWSSLADKRATDDDRALVEAALSAPDEAAPDEADPAGTDGTDLGPSGGAAAVTAQVADGDDT